MNDYVADVRKPRYVRVNTLKLDVETAVSELGKENEVTYPTYEIHYLFIIQFSCLLTLTYL